MKIDADAYYQRVYPRDYFNESKLLKCFGQLSLLLLDGLLPSAGIEIFQDGPPIISQIPKDNSLTIENARLLIDKEPFILKIEINNRSPYPLLLQDGFGDSYHDVEIFENDGQPKSSFISFLKSFPRKRLVWTYFIAPFQMGGPLKIAKGAFLPAKFVEEVRGISLYKVKTNRGTRIIESYGAIVGNTLEEVKDDILTGDDKIIAEQLKMAPVWAKNVTVIAEEEFLSKY